VTNTYRAIARGVAVQFGARVVALVASVVSVGIATRYLGVEQYGILTSAVVFVGLFQTLTELGIGSIIIRRVAAGTGALRDLVSLSLGMSWLYAVPVAVLASLAGLGIYAGDSERQLAVAILSTGLIFNSLASSYQPVFSVHIRFSAVALADVVSRCLTLAVTAAVVAADKGLLAIAAAQAVPPIVQYVVTRVGALRMVQIKPTFRRREALELFRASLPLTMSIFVGVLYWRADGVLLSLISDNEQIGAYGLALPLAFNLSIIGVLFAESSFSPIAERVTTDRVAALRAVQRGMRFLLICAMPVAVLGWPLAGHIVNAIASDEFRSLTTVPLRLFFVAVAVGFFSQLLSDLLLVVHEQPFLLRVSAINLLVNILLNVALIPFLGAVGCGIALVASESMGVLFAVLRLRWAGLAVNPLSGIGRLLLPTAAALAVCLLTVDLPVVVPVLASGLTYGGALLLLRVITVPELTEFVGGGRKDAEARDADPS